MSCESVQRCFAILRTAAIATALGSIPVPYETIAHAEPKPAKKTKQKSKTIRLNKDFSKELPHIPPKSPEESLNCIKVRRGFRVELVAAEPLVRDPVAIDFDEYGRMFVVELPRYNSYAIEDFNSSGSIRMLQDSDGDGRYDTSVVYVDELNYPTAVACWDGGIFVGDAPDLLYCKDTNGDGKADVQNAVFTGFGKDKAGESHLNSIRWRFDNRFHLSTNLAGGDVRATADKSSETASVRSRGFVFDPRDLTRFELTSGGGQHGMSMDNWGRKFVCSNSVPTQTLMYDDRYLVRNPYLQAPAAAKDIFPDGQFTKLFRVSPAEPWRVLRTRLRAAGDVGGSAEGGKPFGFFTAATGVTIYRGDAWPQDFLGNLFVGDVANNILYRARLEENGLSLTARRADADAETEFLASTDIWFRPVQFANGPDGNLYMWDMDRGLIEGAAFLPADILDHLDPVSGYDRGRIYRIVSESSHAEIRQFLAQPDTSALVTMLGHPNGWHRDTASRLLYQRQDKTAIPLLKRLAVECRLPEGRMTALYSLHGLDALDPDIVLQLLDDSSVNVKLHAIRLAEESAGESPAIRDRVEKMVEDAGLQVAYQLAFSLGAIESSGRNAALAMLIRRLGADQWMQLAVQSSLHKGAGEVFEILASQPADRKQTHIHEFLVKLAALIGAANQSNDIAAVIKSLEGLQESENRLAQSVIEALVSKHNGAAGTQLASAGSGKAGSILREMLTAAKQKVHDADADVDVRVQSIRTLGLAQFDEVEQSLSKLLGPSQPQPVQAATLQTLSRFDDRDVAAMLLKAWPVLSPTLRAVAIETLLSRNQWIREFLSAVKAGRISRAAVDPNRVRLLKQHSNQSISTLAGQLFSTPQLAERQTIVDAYQQSLKLNGDAARGKMVFKKVCSACHQLDGVGTAVGADLKAIRDRGLPAVLLNILDPNREVKPKFVNYVLVTNNGLIISGMIVAENANSITIRRSDGTTATVLRLEIDELRGTGLSYMPEGIEKQVDIPAMADLLAYLSSID